MKQTGNYFGLMEAARETGIPFYKITYAEQAGHLPNPMRIAFKRIYTEEDVARIREYFAVKEEK